VVVPKGIGKVSDQDTSRALDRDVFLLSLLAAIATALFLFTKYVATREQQMEVRIAAIWYDTGEAQIGAGAIQKAIDSFQRAVANDRQNRKYAFALADALAAGNHDREAEQTVLRLRELDPENAEINLDLARLASKRGDIPEAVRFYENAIYGLWTGTHVDERRRRVRVELIHFLLAHEQRDRALSELMILNGDLPETAALHTEVGELFLQAGDPLHGLLNFKEAIKLDSHASSALAGAGEASFQVGDYPAAQRYLEAALSLEHLSPHDQHILSLVQMISSADPLARGIGSKERQRRLFTAYEQAFQRLRACLARSSKQTEISDLQALQTEAAPLEATWRSKSIRYDPDLLRSGLDLIYRMEKATNVHCGEPTGMDEALLLIASRRDGQQ
jgi:tetratricopeptide (TPR) repeat protein